MKCPRCQHDNPQGARFCEECATPLARTGSDCGTALSATAKFCRACEHPVAGAGAPTRSPDSYRPFRSRSAPGTIRLTGDTLRLAEDYVELRPFGPVPIKGAGRHGLGKLYRRTDKREQAQEHLGTAAAMYHEMGMTYWMEKAEAETRALG